MRLAVLIAVAWVGCADAEVEARAERQREILRTPDVEKLRVERQAQVRVVSEEGELLESDEVVAGIRLPRGFAPRLALPDEWYYESEAVTFEQLDRYFQARLFTAQIERSEHTVRYDAAKPRNDADAPFVTVRIGAAPSNRNAQQIYIRRPSATARRPIMSPAEVEAEVEAARRVAE